MDQELNDEIIQLDDDSREEENEQEVTVNQVLPNAIEEVVDLVSSDDDEIIIETDNVLTVEELKERRLKRIDDLLSWFVKMKPELVTEARFEGGEKYLENSITDQIAVDIELCRAIVDEFQKTGDLSDICEKLKIPSEQLMILGLCICTLEECNERDINFTEVCYDRVDEWALQETRDFIDKFDISVKPGSKYGPAELIQRIFSPPAYSALSLTILWIKENGYAFRCEFSKNENNSCDLETMTAMQDTVYENAMKYWKNGHKVKEEVAEGAKMFDECFEMLSKIKPQLDADMARIKTALDTISEQNLGKIKDEIEIKSLEVKHEDLLSDEDRKRIRDCNDICDAALKNYKDFAKEMEAIRDQQTSLQLALVLNIGDYCLARRECNDLGVFELAVVIETLRGHNYLVRFNEDCFLATLSRSDLAFPRYGMWHPLIMDTTFVGLRVCCYYERKEIRGEMRKKANLGAWYSGTIGGRSGSHGNEFLVFLDNGEDVYVPAPYSPGLDIVTEINIIPYTTTNVNAIKRRIEMTKMAPMLLQSFNEQGALEKTTVHHLLRDKSRAPFIHAFMSRYPEWRLFRCTVGNSTVVRRKDANNIKIAVNIVHVDRAFVVVRHTIDKSIPGSGCLEYPCTKYHLHEDERLYRGSLRFPYIDVDQHNHNLSKRSVAKIRSQFDTTEPQRQFPVYGEYDHSEAAQESRARRAKSGKAGKSGMSTAEVDRRKRNQNIMTKVEIQTPILKSLNELKFHAKCGPECLQSMDKDPYDTVFHRCSPLHVPMMCGWRRLKFSFKNFRRRGGSRKCIQYFAPCGRPMTSLKLIGEYLEETRSMITIDCFSFDLDVDTEVFMNVDEKYVKMADYTEGVEGIPIPAVNSVDNEEPPRIEYCKRRFQYDASVDIATINRDFCSGCTCEGDCSVSSTCECRQLSIDSYSRLPTNLMINQQRKNMTAGTYDNRMLDNKIYSGIYECNDQCTCKRKTCHNRVVQNNIKYPMQVFKTAESGWGVRALTDIPKGAFLCNYVGALLTNELADQLKNDDQYFADLDLKDVVETEKCPVDTETDQGYDETGDSFDEDDERGSGDNGRRNCSPVDDDDGMCSEDGNSSNADDFQLRRSARHLEKKKKEEKRIKELKERKKLEQNLFKWNDYFQDSALFVVDAKQRGNIGRFLNHSCDPNVHVQHVLYDTHDLRLPWVAFFTLSPVKAGEELCWDYSYTILKDDDEQIFCKCGADICRGRLL